MIDELLERIREIRASERRFYQKVSNIYSLASDYDKDAPMTKESLAHMQNKLHWAITGRTAEEMTQESANASVPRMGLTRCRTIRLSKTRAGGSALEPKLKAEAEYDEFRAHQDREYASDFDREVH